jgi:transcriptional regulator NrdR family protein
MKGKLIDFSNTRLKQLYEEDKEKRELKQKQQEILYEEVEGEVEKVVEEEKIEDDVVEKNVLPDGMSDDLVAYF